MLCSVIVPTYNRSQLLAHTLESLCNQTLPAPMFEVLVIDDGSSDDTAEVVETFSGRLQIKYWFQEDRGYRVAAARNIGIKQAQAAICVFVDSGVLVVADFLHQHISSHLMNPDAAVTGYVFGFNEDNEDAVAIRSMIDVDDVDQSVASMRQAGHHLDIRESFYQRYGEQLSILPAPWVMYWTCNVSARKDRLLDAGLFDEHFTSWGAEDIDLAYRLFQGGSQFVLNRQAAAIHYPHDKSYESNMASAAGNYQYFARKYNNPICDLVPDHHFDDINDIILEKKLSVEVE